MPDLDRPRNEAIDVVRFLAATCIVFIHSVHTDSPYFDRWGHALRFAVPFYLFASLYFQSLSLKRNPDRSFGRYVLGRFKRLYLPFLAWSVIYLIARDALRLMLHQPVVSFRVDLLWQGTEYHLYFLPLLLTITVIFAGAYCAFLRHSPRWRWPLIGLATMTGLAFAVLPMPASWSEVFDNPTYGLVWSWRALPAAFWAMAFAWWMTGGTKVRKVPTWVGLTGLIVAIGCSLQQVWQGILLIPRALTGIGTLLLALSVSNANRPPSVVARQAARAGRYSYGMYLNHVLIVEVVRVLLTRGHEGFESSVLGGVGMFLLSLAASIGLALLLARSPKTAWLNG